MLVSFFEIKRETLIALYQRLHVGDGQVYWYPKELASFVDTNASISMIAKSLISLEKERLVESTVHDDDPDETEMYTLSDAGIVRAEQLTGNVDPAFGSRSNVKDDDELISVDHTQPKAVEVEYAIEALKEKLQGVNDAFIGDRSAREAAIAEVSSIQALWQSGSIRLKSLKERAKSTLKWIAEKAGSSVIAEACKHLFKLIVGW